jgi:hypothetical protein
MKTIAIIALALTTIFGLSIAAQAQTVPTNPNFDLVFNSGGQTQWVPKNRAKHEGETPHFNHSSNRWEWRDRSEYFAEVQFKANRAGSYVLVPKGKVIDFCVRGGELLGYSTGAAQTYCEAIPGMISR